MIDGETGFLFADGDDFQQLVVDLGQLRYIKSIGVHLTPAGRDRAVWDYIRVQVSLDNRVWTDWQLVGVPDGVVDITNFIYEVSRNLLFRISKHKIGIFYKICSILLVLISYCADAIDPPCRNSLHPVHFRPIRTEHSLGLENYRHYRYWML